MFSIVAEDDINGASVFDALAYCDNIEVMCEWKAESASGGDCFRATV